MCGRFIIIIFDVCILIQLNGCVIRLYAVRFDFLSLFSSGTKVVFIPVRFAFGLLL